MSPYTVTLFLHIVGAIGLFTALGLEWTAILNLRRAGSVSQAQEWAKALSSVRFVGAPSVLLTLVTGLFLMSRGWGGPGWIVVGLAGLVAIAGLGGALSGRRSRNLARAVAAESGAPSAELGRALRDPVLLLSLRLRTGLGLGIVFIMATKPTAAASLIAIGVAMLLALAAGFSVRGRARTVRAEA